MGLKDIQKKAESLGKKSNKTFLQINKYDYPSNAMDLIGHICTAAKDIDFSNEFEPIYFMRLDMEKERKDNKFTWGCNIEYEIDDILGELEKTYLDNTYQLKIAVAGGYSAGKSTFMNMLIGKKEFLPTDMNPTSLVNTYINFNGSIVNAVVRGENIKDNLVLLDEDVLASIRHDTQNAKVVANVLKRLIIDVPCADHLDGITFIDTPGYDNSIAENRENNTTDKQTAEKAFKDAEIIFWCANIKKQVTEEDLKFIEENGGKEKPIVILLSRMKSIDSSSIAKTIDCCYQTVSKRFKNNLIDVIAFDRDISLDEIYSKKGKSISQLFNEIKKEHQDTVLDLVSFTVYNLFDSEKKDSENAYTKYKQEYDLVIDKLNKARKKNSYNRSDIEDSISDLEEILIDNYNELDSDRYNLLNSASDALDNFESFYKKVKKFDDNRFMTDSFLNEAMDEASLDLEICKNNHKSNYEMFSDAYEETYRKELINRLKRISGNSILEDNSIDYYENKKKELSDDMSAERARQKCIAKYQPLFENELKKTDIACRNKRAKHYKSLEKLENTKDGDVFSAISGNNTERFMLCFHTGVELSTCNSLGFNVLTWIVTLGNTEMLDFILRHKDTIDPSIKDKNGINIMEAAIMAHNKPACMAILKAIPELKVSASAANQLIERNDFYSWIKTLL